MIQLQEVIVSELASDTGNAGAMHGGIEDVVHQDSASAEVINALQRFRDAEARQVTAELGAVDIIERQRQLLDRSRGCGADQGDDCRFNHLHAPRAALDFRRFDAMQVISCHWLELLHPSRLPSASRVGWLPLLVLVLAPDVSTPAGLSCSHGRQAVRPAGLGVLPDALGVPQELLHQRLACSVAVGWIPAGQHLADAVQVTGDAILAVELAEHQGQPEDQLAFLEGRIGCLGVVELAAPGTDPPTAHAQSAPAGGRATLPAAQRFEFSEPSVAPPRVITELLATRPNTDLAGLRCRLARGHAQGDDTVADAFQQLDGVLAAVLHRIRDGTFWAALVEPMPGQQHHGIPQHGWHWIEWQVVAATQVSIHQFLGLADTVLDDAFVRGLGGGIIIRELDKRQLWDRPGNVVAGAVAHGQIPRMMRMTSPAADATSSAVPLLFSGAQYDSATCSIRFDFRTCRDRPGAGHQADTQDIDRGDIASLGVHRHRPKRFGTCSAQTAVQACETVAW
ncbi:hypothetical protein COLO4_01026 [Corchorus olitorius]|uniref:Uncharacterized protein n=1 Tax=Corchorus olitorius TaxID=93759 RepID=A0A1R3L386_9ROSI|nr:hypothetical protein COLO4_01026 [Corchorus olitorius]